MIFIANKKGTQKRVYINSVDNNINYCYNINCTYKARIK